MSRCGRKPATGGQRRRRRGAALVETALVLPIVLLFLCGILEYGRYIMMLQLTTNAAREGAQYALKHSQPITIAGVTYQNTTNDVLRVVQNAMGGQRLVNQQVQVFASDSRGNNLGSWNDAEAGDCICVRITGNYPATFARLLRLPASIPMTAQRVMRTEAN